MSMPKKEPSNCVRCEKVRKLVARGLCNACYVYFARARKEGKTDFSKLEADGKCKASTRKVESSSEVEQTENKVVMSE